MLVAGVVLASGLGFGLSAQVVAESVTQQTKPGTGTLDMSVLDDSLASNLDAKFELAQRSPASGPMNLVLVTLEDTSAAYIGACGRLAVQTPSIDSLARAGTLSCNTYAEQPQTNPAFASLFTSTYPGTHGVRVHMVDRLSDSFDTLAEVLSRNGYTTGAVLPWTSLDPAFSGLHQGFQVYEAYVLNEPATLQNPLTEALGALYRRLTDQVALPGLIERVLRVRHSTEEEIDG